MATLERTNQNINTYQDLRGYMLEGTEHKWSFKVTPTFNQCYNVRILLKPMSPFSFFMRSLHTHEFDVDLSRENFLSVVKSSIEQIVSTEHIKRIICDQEL